MTAPRVIVLLLTAAIAGQSAPAPTRPTVAVEIDAASVDNRISPHLYGQFLEFMFEGINQGLFAELIRDRSFEEPPDATGLSRFWQRYPDNRNDDYGLSLRRVDDAAYPDRAAPDGTTGGHALRVHLTPAVIARHGLYQARVPIRADVAYRGYVWMKADTFAGTVTAALEADGSAGRVYAEAPLATANGEWKAYPFTLRPATTDPHARFALLFGGEGDLWIDRVSLMPEDAVDGVRADVFEKIRALHPAFIRWPGGNVAQDYHWAWGVGPRDTRPTWINLSWQNALEPSDFGTAEFIRFARDLGAEPSITVNVEGRGATAAEAAAWVEYCNGPTSSTYGAMRARDGHPQPYQVRYWEIGNEIWGDWVRGHSDAATYARNLTKYLAAMRAVDPSIQVIAVGDNDMAWNRRVLEDTREPFDYLAVHHYYSRRDMQGDVAKLLARPLHYERFYADMDALLRERPSGRRPRLAINEWGLDLPEAQQYSVLGALYAARLMNVFERRGDLVAMSAVSDLVNGWPGGIIQADRTGLFVTPIYLVNTLYASRRGAERLRTTLDGDVVDLVASRSADGRSMYLKAVNTALDRAVTAQISIRGMQVSGRAAVERVVADSVTAVNSFAIPDAVKITREDIPAGNRFVVALPAHSVAVVTLTVGK